MKILHILPSVNPEGGGPSEVVRRWGSHARTLGHAVEVVTLDEPGQSFVEEFPLPAYALGPSQGGYRYNSRLVPWLRTHAPGYDAIIVNGIWMYHSFAAWRALRAIRKPYHVFTHGMLDPWFRHEYPLKHLKKWMYWPWAEYRVLRDARAVLFTSEEERRAARKSFWLYRANERVVSYGTAPPPVDRHGAEQAFLGAFPALAGRRFLLFLGRIHEKKGCDMLIRAFAECAAQAPDLQLVMAGPDQTGWVTALKALAAELGVGERITWPGMLRGLVKWGAFHCCEAFVLPSHQENFGIAVAESLACGRPVLISNKVNIWREIEADGAGLVAPDTRDGTRELLGRWLALPADARLAMTSRAARSFGQRYTVEAMAHSLLAVLGDGRQGNPVPDHTRL